MRKSLELYGLQAPSLFYTDNVIADKGFLEGIYPSLREDVVPIEKYSNLEPLVVPPDIQVFLKNTRPSINDALSTILDDLPSANLENAAPLVVGFDSEWNVEVSPNGNVYHRGKTAVVQIAYQTRIYILQVYINDRLLLGYGTHFFGERLVICWLQEKFRISSRSFSAIQRSKRLDGLSTPISNIFRKPASHPLHLLVASILPSMQKIVELFLMLHAAWRTYVPRSWGNV